MSYRWTQHRAVDEAGNDKTGLAAISLWRVARAAAEETLQGSPMVPAWLKLFATHLSTDDTHWLRWRGDFAESAELRRAYSGLYGRFLARSLLEHHLKLSRFITLKRNGVEIPGSAKVTRTQSGDIPDWIAWDEANSRFVLAEAKGSLTGSDFHAPSGPKCVHAGKEQFGRVQTHVGGRLIQPGQWVAATRWATDVRSGYPITILWDPPFEDNPFSEEEARHHRTAMTRAWLDSIAPGFGLRSADDLLSASSARRGMVVRANPGETSPTEAWPAEESDADKPDFIDLPEGQRVTMVAKHQLRVEELIRSRFVDSLTETNIYNSRDILDPPKVERKPHERSYTGALITRFGIRPVRTAAEFDALLEARARAQEQEEPALFIGLPLDFDPALPSSKEAWLDGAGIASDNGLALFDLRSITVEPLDELPPG